MLWSKKITALIIGSWLTVTAFAATEMLTFDNETLRERYKQLTYELRCPKCQNQNVADSLAPISADIRHKTYAMLHQGYSDQEIIDFMVARYTEFVIYKPQMSIVTIWLWVIPAVLLLSGFIVLWRFTHRQAGIDNSNLTEDETLKLKTLLEENAE